MFRGHRRLPLSKTVYFSLASPTHLEGLPKSRLAETIQTFPCSNNVAGRDGNELVFERAGSKGRVYVQTNRIKNLVRMRVGTFISSRLCPFDLGKVRVLPGKNRMTSVPACSLWISPFLVNVTQTIGDYRQLASQVSLNEEEVIENFNQILAAIGSNPRSSTEGICTTFIDKLCKAGNLSVAARLLRLLQDKNIFVGPRAYNILLVAAGEKHEMEILSQVFKDLVVSCKPLPSISYLNLAKAFIKTYTNDIVQLLRLVEEVSELTFPSSAMVINRVILAFGECRQFDKALMIFDRMKGLKCKPDLVTYNTVLHILGYAGRVNEMLNEFSSMKEAGIFPDFISYNTVLNQLRKVGRLDLCLAYFREMSESGIEPDLLTYTALIGSFGRSGNVEESLRLFNEMKTRKIRPSIYVYRYLINSSKKMGRLELAKSLLEEMNASLPDLAGPKDFKPKSSPRTRLTPSSFGGKNSCF